MLFFKIFENSKNGRFAVQRIKNRFNQKNIYPTVNKATNGFGICPGQDDKIWFVCSKGSAYPISESEIIKLNTFIIDEAIKYLQDHRYQITQKDNIYFLFDIDDSNAQLEIYNEKELIAHAEQLKEEFSK